MRHASNCGYYRDCARSYTAQHILDTAATWELGNKQDAANLERVYKHAWQQCTDLVRNYDNCSKDCFASETRGVPLKNSSTIAKSGGWCLRTKSTRRWYDNFTFVHHGSQSYYLPHPHVAADSRIVDYLVHLLRTCRDPPACRDARFLSLNDFGAGVGQYGRALLAVDPRFQYRGYDGAGNIADVSDNFVGFFDLTIPLSLPRADWLLSLEVGEHIPSRLEEKVIRNLHAHNCRGLILSWAYLGKPGVGHVNNHGSVYLVKLFDELGYTFDETATKHLRANRNKRDGIVKPFKLPRELAGFGNGHTGRWSIGQRNISRAWFWLTSVHVFRRRVPLQGNGCSADL